ncbi:MAG: hypothetical protein CMB80_15465 [Flammeovirgaceae bacterium]|nr:hypothetical protein [Flammeovirgaceae bacterium]|tara:strand:+ start:3329 stop:4348 length:1020 start_codon:yes stop_codon:yes gene_type:complete
MFRNLIISFILYFWVLFSINSDLIAQKAIPNVNKWVYEKIENFDNEVKFAAIAASSVKIDYKNSKNILLLGVKVKKSLGEEESYFQGISISGEGIDDLNDDLIVEYRFNGETKIKRINASLSKQERIITLDIFESLYLIDKLKKNNLIKFRLSTESKSIVADFSLNGSSRAIAFLGFNGNEKVSVAPSLIINSPLVLEASQNNTTLDPTDLESVIGLNPSKKSINDNDLYHIVTYNRYHQYQGAKFTELRKKIGWYVHNGSDRYLKMYQYSLGKELKITFNNQETTSHDNYPNGWIFRGSDFTVIMLVSQLNGLSTIVYDRSGAVLFNFSEEFASTYLD